MSRCLRISLQHLLYAFPPSLRHISANIPTSTTKSRAPCTRPPVSHPALRGDVPFAAQASLVFGLARLYAERPLGLGLVRPVLDGRLGALFYQGPRRAACQSCGLAGPAYCIDGVPQLLRSPPHLRLYMLRRQGKKPTIIIFSPFNSLTQIC